MKIFSLVLVAGEKQTLPSGSFLQYLDGTDPVNLEFVKENGTIIMPADGARPGYKADFRSTVPLGVKAFGTVRVTSDTNQSVEFGISDAVGDYNRFSGDVLVSGVVDVNFVSQDEVVEVNIVEHEPLIVLSGDQIQTEAVVLVDDAAPLIHTGGVPYQQVIFFNESPIYTVYLGESGVEVSTGIPLGPLERHIDNGIAGSDWYAVAETGESANVRIMVGDLINA